MHTYLLQEEEEGCRGDKKMNGTARERKGGEREKNSKMISYIMCSNKWATDTKKMANMKKEQRA